MSAARTAPNARTFPATGDDDRSRYRHWVTVADKEFSAATGVSIPALCGYWLTVGPNGEGEIGADGRPKPICSVCQRVKVARGRR